MGQENPGTKNQKEITPPSLLHSRPGRETAQTLAKKIFDAEVPEQFVRTIPPQSIYQVLREYGIGQSTEILELVTRDQMQCLLDFDLWQGDSFHEDRLWEWLELPEATESLMLLQRVLAAIDLKLVSLLISRYVAVIIKEEPSETPPQEGFYTPDKGSTWIAVQHPDETKSFFLNRFLALIFETKAELFYQLISIPDVTTPSQLQEESFQERSKRLLNEGVPDAEWAAELHTPIASDAALELLRSEERSTPVQDIHAVRPIIYQERLPEPLRSLLAEYPNSENAEMEITLILNSGMVRWQVDFSDWDGVHELVRSLRGAINVGLEFFEQNGDRIALVELVQRLGFRKIYQTGLGLLFELRKRAKALRKNLEQLEEEVDAVTLALLDGLEQPLPKLPSFIDSNGDVIEMGTGKLEGGFRAIEHLKEVTWAKRTLQ